MDEKKASEYFMKEVDDMFCQYWAAWCYDFGEGVKEDIAQAIQWYEKSAIQGYSIAQFYLGLCLKNEGVHRNLTKSWQYFRKAASQGHTYAKKQLDEPIFVNFIKYDNTRNALICLIGIRKFKDCDVCVIPKDVVLIIA